MLIYADRFGNVSLALSDEAIQEMCLVAEKFFNRTKPEPIGSALYGGYKFVSGVIGLVPFISKVGPIPKVVTVCNGVVRAIGNDADYAEESRTSWMGSWRSDISQPPSCRVTVLDLTSLGECEELKSPRFLFILSAHGNVGIYRVEHQLQYSRLHPMSQTQDAAL